MALHLIPDQPRFWMDEVSGQLHSAVEAYLHGDAMESWQIPYLRAYLRQWIASPVWCDGPDIDELRSRIDGLTSTKAISEWLDLALVAGIDPL
jgi:hypothetical protein